MTDLTLPSYYLPPVSYFRQLAHSETATIEVCEHYVKQTLRNRCWIDSPAGPLSLSIPIEKTLGKTAMRDICISDHGNWRHQHWNALVSSYGQSPFFEFYADEFAPFYERKWTFLVDFNEDLLQMLCRELDLPTRFNRTTSYVGETTDSQFDETPRPYYQMFAHRHGFLPDLSVVDLLFNMGNESILYL